MDKVVAVKISAEEIEIVRSLSDDNTVAETAEKLGYAPRTMEGRILMLRKKCNSRSVGGLIAFFFKNKLLK